MIISHCDRCGREDTSHEFPFANLLEEIHFGETKKQLCPLCSREYYQERGKLEEEIDEKMELWLKTPITRGDVDAFNQEGQEDTP